MQFVSRTLALLLLTTLAVTPMAAQIVPLLTASPQPAGCHQHGSKTPAPRSTDHACCEAGHSTALLQESFSLRIASLEIAQVAFQTLPVVFSNSFSAECVDLPSGRSPALAPLRI
jgi:hypothetical protein